jgi:hypothetical protein
MQKSIIQQVLSIGDEAGHALSEQLPELVEARMGCGHVSVRA